VVSALWLVRRTDHVGWDEWDAVVVVASSADEARAIHPNGWELWDGERWIESACGWATPDTLAVERLGEADDGKPRVVLASFNAG
jgi:hypothetical protein